MAAGTAAIASALASKLAHTRASARWILILAALGAGICMRTAAPAPVQWGFAQLRLGGFGGAADLLGACILSVLIHELGHLIAAVLLNFAVVGGSLGPLRVIRRNGRWGIQLSGANLLRGSVAAVPVTSARWRPATMIVVAAGPTATWATFIASCWAMLHANGGVAFWAAMTQLNLLIGALSLIPFRAEAVPSDARLFLDLLKDGAEAQHIASCFCEMRRRAGLTQIS